MAYNVLPFSGGIEMKLILKYSLFTVIAMFSNIIVQYTVFNLFNEFQYSLYIAMASGTIVGLITKYVLDKKYIFYFKIKTLSEDFKKFLIYSILGVFTTIIFWATEISFNILIKTESSKYIGAIIGLSIGYYIKYHLDKKFVFKGGPYAIK